MTDRHGQVLTLLAPKVQSWDDTGAPSKDALTQADVAAAVAWVRDPLGQALLLLDSPIANHTTAVDCLEERLCCEFGRDPRLWKQGHHRVRQVAQVGVAEYRTRTRLSIRRKCLILGFDKRAWSRPWQIRCDRASVIADVAGGEAVRTFLRAVK